MNTKYIIIAMLVAFSFTLAILIVGHASKVKNYEELIFAQRTLISAQREYISTADELIEIQRALIESQI